MLEKGVVGEPFDAVNATYERDDRTGEVQRKAIDINYYLWRVRILNGIHSGKRLTKGGNLCVGMVKLFAYRLDLRGLNKGLIALYVNNDVSVGANLFSSFFNAVGAAVMVRTRHDGFTAKRLHGIENTLIVSSNVRLRQYLDNLMIDAINDCVTA